MFSNSALNDNHVNVNYHHEQLQTEIVRAQPATMPYVKITEQPTSKALRFRYECEGRLAGSIPGVNSTPSKKTYPSIQVIGYRGDGVVVVSCVTKDPPYRPHPYNLVGKDNCKLGVCTMPLILKNMSATFTNLGIQCVKKKDIDESLRVREQIRVDPFRNGFSHRTTPSKIDLNAVRLCFQVFLEKEKGRFTVPLQPVVSDPIYDKKTNLNLIIYKLSHCSCSVIGGKEIILLCEKVCKDDIAVRFFEDKDGQVVWEGYGDFQHSHVHKQVAISFKSPPYRDIDVDDPVRVYVQLKRPSDGILSEPLPFDYLPLDSDLHELKRKRQRLNGETHLNLVEAKVMPTQGGTIGQPSSHCNPPSNRHHMVTAVGDSNRQVGTPVALHYNIPPSTSYMHPNPNMAPMQQQQQQQQQQQHHQYQWNIPHNNHSPLTMSTTGQVVNDLNSMRMRTGTTTTMSYQLETKEEGNGCSLLAMDSQQLFQAGEFYGISYSGLNDGNANIVAAIAGCVDQNNVTTINNQTIDVEQEMSDSFTRLTTAS